MHSRGLGFEVMRQMLSCPIEEPGRGDACLATAGFSVLGRNSVPQLLEDVENRLDGETVVEGALVDYAHGGQGSGVRGQGLVPQGRLTVGMAKTHACVPFH